MAWLATRLPLPLLRSTQVEPVEHAADVASRVRRSTRLYSGGAQRAVLTESDEHEGAEPVLLHDGSLPGRVVRIVFFPVAVPDRWGFDVVHSFDEVALVDVRVSVPYAVDGKPLEQGLQDVVAVVRFRIDHGFGIGRIGSRMRKRDVPILPAIEHMPVHR